MVVGADDPDDPRKVGLTSIGDGHDTPHDAQAMDAAQTTDGSGLPFKRLWDALQELFSGLRGGR